MGARRSLTLAAFALAGLAAGCTGVDPTLGTASGAPPPAATASPAPSLNGTVVALAPATGVSPGAAAALAEGFGAEAAASGLRIAAPGDPTALYLLKGYFSAVPEASDTTVVFVFDVLDAAGSRVHRIQGTEKSPGAGGWETVSADTMRRIAGRAVSELSGWASARPG